MADVGLQRPARLHGQRQDFLLARLRTLERDSALAPVNVGQLKPVDLDTAQSQVQRQTDDGVAPPSRR